MSNTEERSTAEEKVDEMIGTLMSGYYSGLSVSAIFLAVSAVTYVTEFSDFSIRYGLGIGAAVNIIGVCGLLWYSSHVFDSPQEFITSVLTPETWVDKYEGIAILITPLSLVTPQLQFGANFSILLSVTVMFFLLFRYTKRLLIQRVERDGFPEQEPTK